jgi:hypothetical protein
MPSGDTSTFNKASPGPQEDRVLQRQGAGVADVGVAKTSANKNDSSSVEMSSNLRFASVEHEYEYD